MITENNKLLSREHAHMCLQTRIIKNTSNYEKISYDASKYLTKLGFDDFKKEFISLHDYSIPSNQGSGFSIYYQDNTETPHIFSSKNTRFNCAIAVAMMQQCCHEILLKGEFCKEYFGKRWIRRPSVTKSFNVGYYKNLK